jgi:glycosyltransferase involved in cell wall biosynthesis
MAIMGEIHRPMFDGLIAQDRIAVVPNGTPDLEPEAAERDPDLVLFLSNLRARKGLPQAVEAAVRVVRARPSTRFVFVGSWEPALEEPMRAVAREAGDQIAFFSPVAGDEKRDLLLRASVFLFPPAEPEGHPRVVLEAISAGLPIVTTDRGAIAETVGPDAGVVLADPDPTALAEAVERLLSDTELRERMGAAARARYESLFTQEQADLRIARWLEGLRD